MRLEGSLDAFSLPDIFALLSMTKKTGGLHLRREAQQGVVWLAEGLVTGGSTGDGRDLARRAVATAATRPLSPDEVTAALAEVGSSGSGLVTLLTERGLLDHTRVADLACDHVVEVVSRLMSWTQGDFEFVVDETGPDQPLLARGVDEVMADARERLAAWADITRTLPAADALLHVRVDAAAGVTLTADQWALVTLADGRRTVTDLLRLSGRGDYATARCLVDLLGSGVLSVTADDGVAAHLARLAAIDGAGPVALPEPPAPQSFVPEQPAGDAAAAAADPATAPARESAPAAEPTLLQEFAELTATRPALVPDAEPAAASVAALLGESPADAVSDVDAFETAVVDFGAESTPMPATVGALATVPDLGPLPHADRDPDVNKSLLLRLIAGVRGL